MTSFRLIENDCEAARVLSSWISMKILVFYVDKQYFNMVILLLRLRVRRELIIRRDGRAVEGTGLENRRCESIRGFESHSLRQLHFPSTCGSTQEAEGAPLLRE